MQEAIETKITTNAFTIIEIIVALTVLGTTAVAIFGAISVCSTATHHTRMLTRAVLLGETQLANAQLSGNMAFGIEKGKTNLFKWQVHIVPTKIEGLAAVKVQVTWLEQQRQQHYELLSLMRIKSFEQNQF